MDRNYTDGHGIRDRTVLLCRNLEFGYTDDRKVIDKISYKFTSGRLYGILGPNGSGKTTFIKLLLGLLKPDKGEVILFDKNIEEMDRIEIAKRTAYVSQTYSPGFDFPVRDVVLMGRYPYISRWAGETSKDKKIAESIMEKLEIMHLADRSFSELSGGEQQKVMIARALAQQPEIMILDEPTSHLDISHSIAIMDMLRRTVARGLTVIAVLHDINLAAMFCDDIIMMKNGKIKVGGPVDSVITADNIRRIFGVRVAVMRHPETRSLYITPHDPSLYITPTGGCYPSEIRNGVSSPTYGGAVNGDELRIHIIAGGGYGRKIFGYLTDYDVSVGVLHILDDDEYRAEELGFTVITEAPFSPISDRTYRELLGILGKVDILIIMNIPFGPGNIRNLEAAVRFAESGGHVFMLENGPPERLDFTGGRAAELREKLSGYTNVKKFSDIMDLLNAVENYAVLKRKRK